MTECNVSQSNLISIGIKMKEVKKKSYVKIHTQLKLFNIKKESPMHYFATKMKFSNCYPCLHNLNA